MRKWFFIVPIMILYPALAAYAAGPALPVDIRTFRGIKYYNGGAGIDERSQLPQLYSLKLVFATDRGHYLSNVEVKITAAGSKEVFQVRADNGPWLVVDLPPGTYNIAASQEGHLKKAAPVKLSAKSRRAVILRWKTTEIDMGL